MLSVNGYYDGNVCVLKDKVSEKPQEVIVTFLGKKVPHIKVESLKSKSKKIDSAIDEAFGIWADHDNSVSVDEYVRNMRKGRKFDI